TIKLRPKFIDQVSRPANSRQGAGGDMSEAVFDSTACAASNRSLFGIAQDRQIPRRRVGGVSRRRCSFQPYDKIVACHLGLYPERICGLESQIDVVPEDRRITTDFGYRAWNDAAVPVPLNYVEARLQGNFIKCI